MFSLKTFNSEGSEALHLACSEAGRGGKRMGTDVIIFVTYLTHIFTIKKGQHLDMIVLVMIFMVFLIFLPS